MEHVGLVSRWHLFLDGLEHSPLAFYTALESAIERRRIPDARSSRVTLFDGGDRSSGRVCVRVQREDLTMDIFAAPFGSGFFVSWWLTRPSRRGLLYLALAIGAILAVPVCAATFGFLAGALGVLLGGVWTAIFLLAGLALLAHRIRRGFLGVEPEVCALPVLGPIYDWVFAPANACPSDAAESFSSAIHSAVLEVADGLERRVQRAELRVPRGLQRVTDAEPAAVGLDN